VGAYWTERARSCHSGLAHLLVDAPSAMAMAVEQGMGIGLDAPVVVAREIKAGPLARLYSAHTPLHLDAYLVSSQRHLWDAPVRAWNQFVAERIPVTF